jgi:hypothetical protein
VSNEKLPVQGPVAGTGLSFIDWWFISQLALLLDPRVRDWWITWSPSIAIGLLFVVFLFTEPYKDPQ